jgi:hypothetical protein
MYPFSTKVDQWIKKFVTGRKHKVEVDMML